MSTIFINTDGGSRGNPGPAAIGVVFYDEENSEVFTCSECIGIATNNDAEYQAIIRALKILLKSNWLKENNNPESRVICRLDSKLVVEQINGNYKVKQDHIREYSNEIKELLLEFRAKVLFFHIPREENARADKLVNEALDKEKKKK
jgi:ribonuclease HI